MAPGVTWLRRRRAAAEEAVVVYLTVNAHGYGWELHRATGLPAGRLYPAVRRLERAGLVTSEWVDDTPTGFPRRRQYRRTD